MQISAIKSIENIAENPEECSHSFGYISNSIHNIYSYYLYSLYYFYHDYLCGFIYFYHQCVYYFFLFLLPFYLLGLFSALLFLIVLHCYLYLYQFYIYYPIATVQYRLNQPYEPRRRYKQPQIHPICWKINEKYRLQWNYQVLSGQGCIITVIKEVFTFYKAYKMK